MPSPFPGMDPYLEARSLWPDLHQRMITYFSEVLQPQLRPKYIARIGERMRLATVSRSYVPDVLLVHTMREPAPTLAMAEPLVADEPQVITMLDDTIRHPYIEIIARDAGDVITVIELLSPIDKMDGRDQYLQKHVWHR